MVSLNSINKVHKQYSIRTAVVVLVSITFILSLTYYVLDFESFSKVAWVLVPTFFFSNLIAWHFIIRPMGDLYRDAQEITVSKIKNQFRTMVESMNEGVVIQDSTGAIVDFNPSALQILGLSGDQLAGRDSMDPRWRATDESGNDLPGDQHPAMVSLRTGQSITKVMTIEKPSGERTMIRVNSAPVFGTTDKAHPIQVVSTFQDITQERLIQERLEIGVKAVGFGIWDWDVKNNRLTWDKSMFEVFGIDPSKFEGAFESFGQLLLPEDLIQVRSELQKSWDNRQDYSGEFRIRRPDGKVRLIKAVSKAYYSPKGEILRNIGVNYDITDQRAREISTLNSSRMSSLGEMASGIAHEINNPLAIVIGQLDLLKPALETEPVNLDRVRKAFDRIEKTTQRISRIVRGLRTFSRDGESDAFELVNLEELIEDTVSLCKSRFMNHQVTLETAFPDSPVQLECRSVQISQVILNLLNNAFDAVHEIEDPARRWIRLDFQAYGEFVEIRVTDGGSGIPEDLRNKIMLPFFTTKQVGEGTGLGLSISHGIATAHGGVLKLDESCPNTRFVLLVPQRHSSSTSVA